MGKTYKDYAAKNSNNEYKKVKHKKMEPYKRTK